MTQEQKEIKETEEIKETVESEEIKHIKAARAEFSKSFVDGMLNGGREYQRAYDINPNNAEARFFVKFNDFYFCLSTLAMGRLSWRVRTFIEEHIKNLHSALTDSFCPFIEYVAQLDCSDSEKRELIICMESTYKWIIREACVDEFKYFYSVLECLGLRDLLEDAIRSFYKMGTCIKNVFSGNDYLMECAALPWKEGIELEYLYIGRAEANCGFDRDCGAEEYAAEILKIDPDYVMPKRADKSLWNKYLRESDRRDRMRIVKIVSAIVGAIAAVSAVGVLLFNVLSK